MFGGEYYDGPRRYQTRVKNAQEAHEAIRPDATSVWRRASSKACSTPTSFKVYDLIWKRTMASQMVDARVLRTTHRDLGARARTARSAVLTASGKAIEFAGFRRAYVEGSDDPAAELEEQEAILPQCKVGDRIHSRRHARRSRCSAPSRSGTRRRRRRGSPKRRSSRSWSGSASAGRPPTRRRSPRSSAAATCSARARRWCRASRRLP